MTSAGTGISHSEYTRGDTPVHFLQIWASPSIKGLSPSYYTRHFTDVEKRDRWAHIVAPVGAESVMDEREAVGPAPVHSPLNAFATLLSPTKKLAYSFFQSSEEHKGYVHVVQTSGYNTKEASGAHVRVLGGGKGSVDLKEGDGVYIAAAPGARLILENVGERIAEVLLFDME